MNILQAFRRGGGDGRAPATEPAELTTPEPTERKPTRLPRPWVLSLIGVGCLVLLALLSLVGFRLARPGTLPGLDVAGHEVGGLGRSALATEVSHIIEERENDAFFVTLDHDEEHEVVATRADLGYAGDPSATTEEAWRRGRQANPFLALTDHLRATFGASVSVPLVESVSDGTLDEWVERVAAELDREPVEGAVEIDGDVVTVTEPVDGAEVDRAALQADAEAVVRQPGEQQLVADSDVTETATDPEQVEAVAEEARLAVSAGVRLYRDEAALELTGAEIGDLLSADRAENGSDLELVAHPHRLAVDDELLDELETDPVDAQIQLAGGEIEIVPSVDGFRFDHEVAADQILRVATSEGDREDELDGDITEPELTTEGAEDLQITELVSSFTTHHACCQGRVQNIQRMADMVRGVVVKPGEEFSLNEHVGPRTRAKGFTEGGAIFRGEFIDAVGGGVSQFGTTFFGAAYEGGYEILQHQPHSYYISRYPMGREATLNYPNLDVRIRNDSPYGLLIHTRYTGTSITVDFYGKEWVDVEEFTSSPSNVRPPPEEYEENEDLEPGEERVVQSGRNGFDVTYTRRRHFPDGSSDEQTWSHRYLPEPRIIEHNPADPDDEDDDDGNDDEDDD